MKDSFVLYTKYKKQVEWMSREQVGDLFLAILAYECGEELPDMDGASRAAFEFIKVDLDENHAKYEARCRKNAENVSKRYEENRTDTNVSEELPKSTNVYDRIRTDTKPTDNDNDNDNENENENDSDNDFKTTCRQQAVEPEADTALIPLNDGSAWRPTISLFNEFITSYPGVNVEHEFQQMRAWCLSNPEKRKTKKGVKRFVNSWLSRAQNSATGNRSSPIANRISIVDSWLE